MMKNFDPSGAPLGRRGFLKTTAAITAGAAMGIGGVAHAKAASLHKMGNDGLLHGHEASGMTYRKLGRTNFNASRLVFGCGAALSGGRAVRLLDRALEAGVNFYDIGTSSFYRGSEASFAPFLKANREAIWVSSKAPLKLVRGHEYNQPLTKEQGEDIAEHWSKKLDQSLLDMDTDYIDAYYLMMVDDPAIVRCEELYAAFNKAKEAGKVGHFGISTHKRAAAVLEAMIDTGWYDIAMIGISPAGWYEWELGSILEDGGTLQDNKPLLDRAREAGIGLVGMKTARFLAKDETTQGAFDRFYSDSERDGAFNAFQRAYAYVLKHGVDVMNSDMQNFEHLEENIVAVRESDAYFA
jgi:aryl-alcohol dehydrogenase-like predicted oxidoreductase